MELLSKEAEILISLLTYLVIFTYGYWVTSGGRQLRWWAWSMGTSIFVPVFTFVALGSYICGWFVIELLYARLSFKQKEEDT